jgi:cell division protein FtsL
MIAINLVYRSVISFRRAYREGVAVDERAALASEARMLAHQAAACRKQSRVEPVAAAALASEP